MERNSFCIVSVFLISIIAISGMLFGQRVIDLDKVWGDMRVLGDDINDLSGFSVANGDINGDGYMDIIIGSPGVLAPGLAYKVVGETYVVFGSSNTSSINLDKVSADISVYGDEFYYYSGVAVASGDVNGDDYDDIIIRALLAEPPEAEWAGVTYVIFGSSFPSPPYTFDLNSQSADITIYGDDGGDYHRLIGHPITSGDINGDGYDDIIIGAYCADPPGRDNGGEAYVVFGSSFPAPPYIIDLSTQPADIKICGEGCGDWFAWALSRGDINNDGYDDIIIGAPFVLSWLGKTYVIFGSSFPSPPYTIDLNYQSADITVYGDDGDDQSGYAVASGDINGDSYDDIIISADYADPGGRNIAGETYVIFGGSLSSPPYTIDLNTQSADITIYGDDEWDISGRAVASGDINGDSYDDIIIGAPGADPPGGSRAGETYVIFGRSFQSAPYIIDLNSQPADITVYGDDANSGYGCAIASGDINDDGFDDLICGARDAWPLGRWGAGETYVISGGGAIITAHGLGGSSWINAFSLLGRIWSTFKAFGAVNSQGEVQLAVGDVDGDGQDEIVAGHGEGGSSWVKLFEVDGSLIKPFKAFGPVNSQGEVHLAIGNFDDNPDDKEIAVGHGEGGQSWVKLFNDDGTLIRSFKAFGPANAKGEVHLASGDLDTNGVDEIIAGMGEGGSSRVKIFTPGGTLVRKFKAFGPVGNPGGEVHLVVGNFDADPSVEIAVATGYNGGNWVKLFEKDGTFIRTFKAFGAGGNANGEVQITSADIDNDGVWEIICGHGEGGSSWVKVFKADGTFIRSFKAFEADNTQGEVHLGKSNY